MTLEFCLCIGTDEKGLGAIIKPRNSHRQLCWWLRIGVQPSELSSYTDSNLQNSTEISCPEFGLCKVWPSLGQPGRRTAPAACSCSFLCLGAVLTLGVCSLPGTCPLVLFFNGGRGGILVPQVVVEADSGGTWPFRVAFWPLEESRFPPGVAQEHGIPLDPLCQPSGRFQIAHPRRGLKVCAPRRKFRVNIYLRLDADGWTSMVCICCGSSPLPNWKTSRFVAVSF